LEKLHQEKIKTCVMIAPLLPKAESLVFKLKEKTEEVIIGKINHHYAEWVFKKYQLEKVNNVRSLISLLRKENVPHRVMF